MNVFQLAWRNLWRNRRRTLITAASVFFAVILAAIMTSMQAGVWQNMLRSVVGLHTGTIQIQHPDFEDEPNINNSLVYDKELGVTVAGIRGVQKVTPRMDGLVLASSGERSRVALIMGVKPPDQDQLAERVDSGNFLEEGDAGCVIGKRLADYMNMGIGDTLVLLGQGYHGAPAAGQFVIKGLISLGNPDLNDRAIYVDLAAAQHFFAADNRVSYWMVNLDNSANLKKSAERIQSDLGSTYRIQTWKEILPELDQSIRADTGSGKLVKWILYFIIAFGMLGTILMMTMERQHEFGVLVAIGMKRMRLAVVVVLEGMFIALIGAFFGLGGAALVVGYLHRNPIPLGEELRDAYEQYGFEPVLYFSVDPSIFINETLTVALIAIVISIYPIYKLHKLRPVEAMRQ